VIGCELLLSISCDRRVKISILRKSLENKLSAYEVDFEFLTTTPACMQRVQSLASQLCVSRCDTHCIVSCLRSQIERAI
jgi:hypothetical protein